MVVHAEWQNRPTHEGKIAQIKKVEMQKKELSMLYQSEHTAEISVSSYWVKFKNKLLKKNSNASWKCFQNISGEMAKISAQQEPGSM